MEFDFIAELYFFKTSEGGRISLAKSGYRPHIEFENYPEYLTTGYQIYIGQDTVEPGETIKAKIKIVSVEYFSGKLFKDIKFKFCEGPNIIGTGIILEISNKNLEL